MNDKDGSKFTVNGQRLKHYLGGIIDKEKIVHDLTQRSSNVKLMTIKERLLGGNPIIKEEEEGSINKGRKELKHHQSRVHHHVIHDPFTYNVGSLHPISFRTLIPHV
ncbi:hypothetical protein PIB30_097983 [Stylosanthes scabra]|uniref:Uncharacterized protein n=1 Tax=Stylosanthes scabra TaxID=79078 RepID=A0ABU6WZ19_9FABA|nr:hypothetical protein [Stylosanthes scabra]